MIKYFLTLVVLIAFSFSFADDSEKIILRVQKKYEKIKDIDARFTQLIKFNLSNVEQTVSGQLIWKKGNKYRIEFENQIIVTDGITIWSYSHLSNQVIIDNYDKGADLFSPERVLIDIPQNYSTIYVGNEYFLNKYLSVIMLKPKMQNSHVKYMKLWVDTNDYLMRKIELMDTSNNVYIYIVESIKVNTGVSDNLFKFKIPDGAETFDLR